MLACLPDSTGQKFSLMHQSPAVFDLNYQSIPKPQSKNSCQAFLKMSQIIQNISPDFRGIVFIKARQLRCFPPALIRKPSADAKARATLRVGTSKEGGYLFQSPGAARTRPRRGQGKERCVPFLCGRVIRVTASRGKRLYFRPKNGRKSPPAGMPP